MHPGTASCISLTQILSISLINELHTNANRIQCNSDSGRTIKVANISTIIWFIIGLYFLLKDGQFHNKSKYDNVSTLQLRSNITHDLTQYPGLYIFIVVYKANKLLHNGNYGTIAIK